MRQKIFTRFFVLPIIFFFVLSINSSYVNEEYSVGDKKIRICTLIDC